MPFLGHYRGGPCNLSLVYHTMTFCLHISQYSVSSLYISSDFSNSVASNSRGAHLLTFSVEAKVIITIIIC